MPEPPRQRGSIPPPVLVAIDERMQGEVEILDALLTALARNQLEPEIWVRLHDAAVRDNRIAELTQAFEAVAQEKRIKTLPAATAGEFLYQAAVYASEHAGDPEAS